MAYEKELQSAKDIALKAGKIMLEYFEAEKGLEHKKESTGATEVTIADKKINRLVIEELSKQFDDGIVGEEESTSQYGAGRKWICDPIDGTKAFVIGIPTSMFSLGLVEDGEPVLGVAYDPFLDKMYWAIKGQGSYCNGERLHVYSGGFSDSYVLMTSDPDRLVKYTDIVNSLINSGARPYSLYGAVYKACLVARGSACGYIEKEVNPHDIAATHIIVEEAGGKVTGFDGGKLNYTKYFRGVIFSNGLVHDKLVKAANG